MRIDRSQRNSEILATVLLCLFAVLCASDVYAQYAPILRTSGYSPVYMRDDPAIIVDPLVELYSPDGSPITNVSVEIVENFRSDQDVLQYTNLVADVVGSYNATAGKLTLSGSTNVAAYQEAMRRVEYYNSKSLVYEGSRRIIFNAGDNGIYLSETRHFYEFIPAAGISWYNAYTASTQMYYYGCQGYLMTVTSAAENVFATSQLGGNRGWMGASDVESNKVWKWVCGPEKGLHFFTQGQDVNGCGTEGTNEPGHYSNWNNGEPNDWKDGCEHNEDHAHFLSDGEWNDYTYNNSNIDGYIVEYGGRTNDPPLHFADETILQVQRDNIEPGAPSLQSPVNCVDSGSTGPPGDSLALYGRTQNRRPQLIWQVPLDLDDNKLNFFVWYASGDTNAGSSSVDDSNTSPERFTYYHLGMWTNFPVGGVTNYNAALVGYIPDSDMVAAYTDVYWKVFSYDGVDSSAASEVRRFLCGGRSWTDDPLASSGRCRDEYIMELRDEIDYSLLFRGMSGFSWTDAVIVPGSTPVRDDHVMEMRMAVEQVVTNTGVGRALTNWTDHPIVPMITEMKSSHITELRTAVDGL